MFPKFKWVISMSLYPHKRSFCSGSDQVQYHLTLKPHSTREPQDFTVTALWLCTSLKSQNQSRQHLDSSPPWECLDLIVLTFLPRVLLYDTIKTIFQRQTQNPLWGGAVFRGWSLPLVWVVLVRQILLRRASSLKALETEAFNSL